MTGTAVLRPHEELGAGSWEADLERLAGELRALPANADLPARLEASQRAVALLAVGFAAELEWLARCCELSGSLGEPLIAAPAALDQQVVAVRRVRLAALADRNGQSRPLKVKLPGPTIPADPEPEGPEDGTDAVELSPPTGGSATPKKALRPLSERRRPADPEAKRQWEERRAKRAEVASRRGTLATAPAREPVPAMEAEAQPSEPQPRTARPSRPEPPAGWLNADETAERLGCSSAAVRQWAARGELPPEHVWRGGPRLLRFSPEMQRPQRPEREPSLRERQQLPPVPPGWTRAAEAAELLSVPLSTLASWRKRGVLGDEGTGWCWRGKRETLIADAVIERIEAEAGERIDTLLAQLPPCAAADPR